MSTFTSAHFRLHRLADGDPDETRRTLSRIMQLPAATLVPGHGPVGNTSDVKRLVRYLDQLETLVEEAMRKGMPEDELAHFHIPDEYRQWIFPSFFASNLKFLYQLRSAGGLSAST